MNKLEISPDFTIEDIHKIREYHWEQTKNMGDKNDFYKNKAFAFLKEAGIVTEWKRSPSSNQ